MPRRGGGALPIRHGSCVAYLLFITESMPLVLPAVPPPLWGPLTLVPLVLLATADTLTFLAPFSALGLAVALAFAALLVATAPASAAARLGALPAASWGGVPEALAIAAFCNEGIVVLSPSTAAAMRQPGAYPWTAFWAICAFSAAYLAVGLVGLAEYGGNVTGELGADMLRAGGGAQRAAVGLYCAMLVPTYALVYFVAYEAAEGWWRRRGGGAAPRAIRWAGCVASLGIAWGVPRFGDYLGLIGAFGNALAIYVLPQLAFLRAGLGGGARRGACWAAVAFGAGLAAVGTAVCAERLFKRG